MKKYLLALLILFYCTTTTKVIAQKNVQAKIDSLEIVLKTSKKDTAKISTLLQLCAAYQQIDPYIVSTYFKDATALADEFKDQVDDVLVFGVTLLLF